MPEMQIVVERLTEEAQVGTRCGCTSCHPTATAYRDDPQYERHDPHLAEGPCCCGRFFVIADTVEVAHERAKAMVARQQEQSGAPKGYEFQTQRVQLPWGREMVAVIADLRD